MASSALLIVLSIVSIAVIILIYLQSGKVKNVGVSIVGTQNVELFENTRKRGSDRILHWVTIGLIALFFLLIVIISII